MSVDTDIDALYQEPLSEFTTARNALAKALRGDEAARVRSLAKPTVPAWAVNQLYWRDRRAFDRIARAGADLRRAQIAALQGKTADVRAATSSHREAIGAAVQRTMSLALEAGVHLDADAIARTLEALSLSPGDVTPGRLTRPLQPAGFEALAGIAVARMPAPRPREAEPRPSAGPSRAESAAAPRAEPAGDPIAEKRESAKERATRTRQEAKQRAIEKREAAERRATEKRAAAERRTLEAAVAQARREEERARHNLAEAQKKLADAELRLRAL